MLSASQYALLHNKIQHISFGLAAKKLSLSTQGHKDFRHFIIEVSQFFTLHLSLSSSTLS